MSATDARSYNGHTLPSPTGLTGSLPGCQIPGSYGVPKTVFLAALWFLSDCVFFSKSQTPKKQIAQFLRTKEAVHSCIPDDPIMFVVVGNHQYGRVHRFWAPEIFPTGKEPHDIIAADPISLPAGRHVLSRVLGGVLS